MSNFYFSYGEVEIAPRLGKMFNEKCILDKCICLGLVLKSTKNCGCFWEVQIVYRDRNLKSICKCLPLDDYKVIIIKKGDMQIEI